MSNEGKEYLAEWIHIAEMDLKRVDRLLAINDPGAAGFYLQQALEKFLKAYLLSKGWKLKKIHDLAILVQDAAVFNPDLSKYEGVLQRVSGFYFGERYPPFESFQLTEADVCNALSEVHDLIDIIRNDTGL